MVIMVQPSNCIEIQGFLNLQFFHNYIKHIGSFQQCIDKWTNSYFLIFSHFFFVLYFFNINPECHKCVHSTHR